LFAVQVLDRATGAALAYVPDPLLPGVAYPSPPILGGRGNIVVYVGPMPNRLDPTYRRRLASLDIATYTWTWISSETYSDAPAVANGVIYAWRSAPVVLDAIDEATGTVLWTWQPPEARQNMSPPPNLVVTRNLLFAGTGTRTYALDIASRSVVFEIAKSGSLAISGSRMLYIGGTYGLTAVRLQ
jgi:outer membrane protein assembly factor BamB